MRSSRSSENIDQLSFADALFAPEARAQAVQEKADFILLPALVPVYRIKLERVGVLSTDRLAIQSPQDAARVFETYGLPDKDREHLALLLLDTKNQVIGLHTVSIGILDSALVSPREVFKAAILANAAGIILCHNHPSGDPAPSAEDRRVTGRIAEAGKLLAIELLDHIVLGEAGRFVSLKERGLF